MSQEEVNEDSFSSDEEFDDEEETDSSTDIDAKIAQDDVFDEEFFNCYAALKKKDEKIYDKNVKFFSDKAPTDFNTQEEAKVKEPRITLLSHQLSLKDSDLDEESVKPPDVVQKSHYEKELDEIKKTIEKEIDSDSDDGLLVVKGSEPSDGAKPLTKRKGNDDLLASLWSDPSKLSEEEKYLRDYILNKRYVPAKDKFFSENLDNLSDVEDDDHKPKIERHHVEHHSDEKDFDKIKRVPRNSTKTIRDIVEKKKKREKRLELLERKKKQKQAIKNADYEDIIGDLPTKFPYIETDPVDYGMTAEELLMAPDEELDPAKPVRKKRKKSASQQKVEPLLLPEKETKPTSTTASSKKKKKHKRGLNHKKFAKVGVAPDRLLSYGLSKTKLRKSKLL